MQQRASRPRRPVGQWAGVVCALLIAAFTLHLIASECGGTGPAASTHEVTGVDSSNVDDAAAATSATDPVMSASVEAGGVLELAAAGLCAILLMAAVVWLVLRLLRPDRTGWHVRLARSLRTPLTSARRTVPTPDHLALSICRC